MVWMDRISVLDHKHLPSAHWTSPRRALCALLLAWHKLGGKSSYGQRKTTLKTLVVAPPAWKN